MLTETREITSPDQLLHFPEIVSLDNPEGLSKTVNTLLADRPIVLNGGPMYGTVFLPHLRASVAAARGETEPWETVSIITTWEHACSWIDKTRLNPLIAVAVDNGRLEELTSLMFLRFPAKVDHVDPALQQYCINGNNEIQVFIMAQDYPLLNKLDQQGIHSLLVRSANLHNQPEALNQHEALVYAVNIGSPVVAVANSSYLLKEPFRTRIGGNNIIHIGPEPIVSLLRQGNTGINTTQKFLFAAGLLPPGISFAHSESKPRPLVFPPYECPAEITTLSELTQDLLRSGGL